MHRSGQFAVVKCCTHRTTGEQFAGKFIRKKRSTGSRRGLDTQDIKREVTNQTTDPTSVPKQQTRPVYLNHRPDQCTYLLLFPSSWLATNYNELMVAPGEGRSPMTSSDAEMDFKPIIIIIS